MATNEQDSMIGRNLQRLRSEVGYTQVELAEKMRERGYKWSKTTVWMIETGERPLKLAEAQDVLRCMDLDWTTYLQVLLQGDGIYVNDVDVKAGALQARYDMYHPQMSALAIAYVDYVMTAYAAYERSGDEELKKKVFDFLTNFAPQSLHADYCVAIVDAFRVGGRDTGSSSGVSEEQVSMWNDQLQKLDKEWMSFLIPDDIDIRM
ncbi:helix-turn-helix transcriptional regulator [Bifidobacterium pullorum subsp. saeculare]|uniref:helix-turn-helix domain-containing protein n=1 Tax=Bifidobacterium pullorum TaxID=78448 RepID=UPI00195C4879|nr:helix-turn-helix transcriptional regulator [Bifidobacterium pullorum]MBM6731176.1 helix-turn-helix transcriptional regulator [Bifidobacterium pullorum subsp. saeculare]